MHDHLRTLSPEKKKSWPDHLQALVYAYNCTPHSSTGLSPYYLMFGRDPNLPIDHLLSPEAEVEPGTVDDWLEEHQCNISDALSSATKHTEKQALARTEFYNRKAKQAALRIGTRVFLRNRIPGRNKIQDRWLPTPYKVS